MGGILGSRPLGIVEAIKMHDFYFFLAQRLTAWHDAHEAEFSHRQRMAVNVMLRRIELYRDKLAEYCEVD